MTVQNDSNVKTYTGNGVTTVFPYDFFIPGDSATDQTNVRVTLFEIATGIESAPLAEILWSITGVDTDGYGSVTYTGGGVPLPATHKINIRRVLAYEQNLDLTTQSAYFPQLLEAQLDLIVYQIQQLAEEAARSVKVAVGSGADPDALVEGVLDALEDTQAAAAAASASEAAAAGSAAAAETAKDDAETALGLIGTSVADADASAVAAAASAAAAALSKTAAETAETNAETAETNAEAAETAAAASAATASAAASAASTSATNAQTAETNAETAEAAAVVAQLAAEAAAGGLTNVQTQINAASDTAFLDADMLTARKDADGSLIKRSWANVKALIATYIATLHPLLSLLTTRGDMIYRDASTWTRLPKGTAGQVLTMGADDPAWDAPAAGGQPIPTSSPFPVGMSTILCNISGGTVNNNATVAGSNTRSFVINGTPTIITGATQSGTWTNIAGVNLSNNQHGQMVRIV